MERQLKELSLRKSEGGEYPMSWLLKLSIVPECCICNKVIKNGYSCYFHKINSKMLFNCVECVRPAEEDQYRTIPLMIDKFGFMHQKPIKFVRIEVV